MPVHDLAAARGFYGDLLGFEVTETVGGRFAFLSGGDLHHEIALQAIGEEAPGPAPGTVGLYHVAFEVEGGEMLARVTERLRQRRVPFQAVDHGISWAVYFQDPDGHGLEVYLDRRRHPAGTSLWRGETRMLRADEILPAAA